MISESQALYWMRNLISIAVFLQSIELLQIRSAYRDDGVWDWRVVREEFAVFPRGVRWVLDILLSYRGFVVVLGSRLVAAAALLIAADQLTSPALCVLWGVLILSTLLIALRWRGTFNGGSDSMTMIVLLALGIAAFFGEGPSVARICLGYVSFQVCLSYFVAGFVKLRNREWRNGRVLGIILRESGYDVPRPLRNMAANDTLMTMGSWVIIGFECAYPLALLNQSVFLAFAAVAGIFHLANVYAFGLNRFFWAWASAYPALFYWSSRVIP